MAFLAKSNLEKDFKMVDFEKTTMQFALPTPSKIFTPFVTCALVLMIIGYALAHHATEFTQNQLCISRSAILQFKIWQFVTYSFINACPWNMLFNCFVVLLIGSSIERDWRTKSFAILWLVISVACGLVWVLVSLVFGQNFIGAGTDSCAYGFIAAFGILYRKKRFIFWFWPMEAQIIALIIIGVGIVLNIAQPIGWIWVMGALVSYLYIKFIWRRKFNSPARISRPQNTRGDGFVDLD